MSTFLFFGICFMALAFMLLYRVFKGPNAMDRLVSADCIDVCVDMTLILFALHSGRTIYLDIALVTALMGFISTTLIAKYMEGKL